MLGIDSLYQTLLPRTDLNFKPSCTDRVDYQKQTGQNAPKHDPKKPNKSWWNPAHASLPPDQLVAYLFWNESINADVALVTRSISAKDSANVNLPDGTVVYLPYVVPNTTATWTQNKSMFPMTAMSPHFLSMDFEADRLVSMLPGSKRISVQEAYPQGAFSLDTADPRQPWVIQFPNGEIQFAGMLLGTPDGMYANGVGSPGHWVQSETNQANPLWVPDVNVDSPSASTMLPPCNPVPTGWQLVSVAAGLIPHIELQPINPAAAGPSDSQLVINMAKQVDYLYNKRW